jgi:hypothetical protein
MYYPQTESDEEKLHNFRSVVAKYQMKQLDGLIIKPANGKYPRLACSNLRGKRANEQLVKNLCDGLINCAHPSIIYDIMEADIGLNTEYNIPFSNKPLSFMCLERGLPNYCLQGDEYHISKLLNHRDEERILQLKKIIKLSKLSFEEINTICHFLMRQGAPFSDHYDSV